MRIFAYLTIASKATKLKGQIYNYINQKFYKNSWNIYVHFKTITFFPQIDDLKIKKVETKIIKCHHFYFHTDGIKIS